MKPTPMSYSLHFLKFGGSLITDKGKPHTVRSEILSRVVGEIAAVLQGNPGMRLVLGHGSGSFGHVPAKRYGTRKGVRTAEEWQGFYAVWREAAALNRIVMDALHQAGLPAIAFPPSASVTAADGRVSAWDLMPLRAVLQAGLLPVVYGDVVIDTVRGGTILSTEDLFVHLAGLLHPVRVSLAGIEPGVWADFPTCTRLIPEITPRTMAEISVGIGGSTATDVTGGMASKVRLSLELVREDPGLDVLIFSGETPGAVERALSGGEIGTRIYSGDFL